MTTTARPLLLECPVCSGAGRVQALTVIRHPSGAQVRPIPTEITCPCCLARPLRLVETTA